MGEVSSYEYTCSDLWCEWLNEWDEMRWEKKRKEKKEGKEGSRAKKTFVLVGNTTRYNALLICTEEHVPIQ